MGIFKRFFACLLVIAISVPVCMPLTSCKGKNNAVKTILETDPWYNTKRIELDPKLDPDLYKDVVSEGPFLCHDKYIMNYEGTLIRPELDDYRPTDFYVMGIFDRDGTLLHIVDLEEIMMQMHSAWGFFTVEACCESENGVRLYFNEPISMNMFACDIDLDTGLQVGETKQISLGKIEDKIAGTDYFCEGFYLLEGYEVMMLRTEYNPRPGIAVSKDMQFIYCIDLDKAFGPQEVSYIYGCYSGGDGIALFEATGREPFMGRLELATGNVTKITDAAGVAKNQMISSSGEGAAYLTKATGVYEYALDSENDFCKLNFDNCNVNRYESQTASVLYCDDEKVILGSSSDRHESAKYNLGTSAFVYVIEKADRNPNAGKKVLNIASVGDSLTYFEGEALKVFNEQNQEYFARLVLYDQGEYLSSDDATYEIDGQDRNRYSAMALASGSLISDIRSGTGPDVILGAAGSIDLLDGVYLIDLAPYLESSEFDRSAYYSKIIDAAKMEGKTFFIPTAFKIAGIATNGTEIDAGQTGFTYEQYASFVKEKLNGVEPVTDSSSRMHFLSLCIQKNYVNWLKDQSIDFDSDEFRNLSVFFRDEIPEGITFLQDDSNPYTNDSFKWHEPKLAVFSEEIDGLNELAHINYYGKKVKIMGLPSQEGTGPSANIINSFSITKDSPVEKGAYDFLKILISEDVQSGLIDCIPINRAAVRDKLEKEKKRNLPEYVHLTSYDLTTLLLPADDLFRAGYVFNPKDNLDVIFLDALESVDSILVKDNSVLMIVSEEIPPYLIGQKDIDSVVAAINSRAQIVFKER